MQIRTQPRTPSLMALPDTSLRLVLRHLLFATLFAHIFNAYTLYTHDVELVPPLVAISYNHRNDTVKMHHNQ